MVRDVIFSRIAKEKLVALLEYLESRWSVRVRDEFISKFDKCIYIIQNEPDVFPASDLDKKQHRCVVTKQTTIYYRFNAKQIRITTLFDTRQHPNKINKDL